MKLLTAKETREYFKITPATLSRWKMEGKIKAKDSRVIIEANKITFMSRNQSEGGEEDVEQ